jgi:hypothetical protein
MRLWSSCSTSREGHCTTCSSSSSSSKPLGGMHARGRSGILTGGGDWTQEKERVSIVLIGVVSIVRRHIPLMLLHTSRVAGAKDEDIAASTPGQASRPGYSPACQRRGQQSPGDGPNQKWGKPVLSLVPHCPHGWFMLSCVCGCRRFRGGRRGADCYFCARRTPNTALHLGDA